MAARFARIGSTWLALALLAGCATGRYAAPPAQQSYDVRSDEALIVFMRVSSFGGAISSSIFDVTGEGEQIVGIPGPNEKLAHYAEPGRRRFMVIAENADFLEAELEAGKAYYAVITPRIGAWKARFSLHPFKQSPVEPEFALGGPQHLKWLAECKLIDTPPSAAEWAANNAASIHAKRTSYVEKWSQKGSEELRARTLEAGDGLASALP
ncbi:MAG TPA: hypothetical protein VFT98_09540 [Myxococcota bacterium]|nr:hypothetical protein [Myxococcota bacterium]